jgi:hypothetical protein
VAEPHIVCAETLGIDRDLGAITEQDAGIHFVHLAFLLFYHEK